MADKLKFTSWAEWDIEMRERRGAEAERERTNPLLHTHPRGRTRSTRKRASPRSRLRKKPSANGMRTCASPSPPSLRKKPSLRPTPRCGASL